MAAKKLGTAQLEELKGWGIPVPPTDVSRFRLWTFVKKGSTQWGADESARISYAQGAFAHWAGKRVTAHWQREKKEGTARYLVFRSRAGIQLRRQSRQAVAEVLKQESNIAIGPFDVAVQWDGASGATMNSPASLTIVTPPTT